MYRALPDSGTSKTPVICNLPYRLIFAVATTEEVLVYSTHTCHPIAIVRDLHLAAVTDLAWSVDGLTLLVSSRDGYCSIVSFDPDELGTPLPLEEYPLHLQRILEANQKDFEVSSGKVTVPQTTETHQVDGLEENLAEPNINLKSVETEESMRTESKNPETTVTVLESPAPIKTDSSDTVVAPPSAKRRIVPVMVTK